MTCSVCHSKYHSTKGHFQLKDRIEDKGFPRNQKGYEKAHEKADKVEKREFPKGYEKMKKVDANWPKNQLAGTNKKNGEIEVSKKVPPKLRKEVATHERVESKALSNQRKVSKKGK